MKLRCTRCDVLVSSGSMSRTSFRWDGIFFFVAEEALNGGGNVFIILTDGGESLHNGRP